MRKRVGILTLYYKNRNYGGLLQAYALRKVISDFGYECEQISYQLSKTPLKRKIENAINYGGFRNFIITIFIESGCKRLLQKIFANKISKKCLKREKAFNDFIKKIPHSEKIYTCKNIEEISHNYDIYVVGSDQIWNVGIDLETFLLDFVKSNKTKISYAASSGGITYKGNQKIVIQKKLLEFDAISVRENGLKQQLEKLGIKNIKNTIDPVFLLSRREWKEILIPSKIKEKYIVCYFLGTNQKQRKIAERVAQQMKCKLVVFPYILNNSFRFCDMNFGDIRDYKAGPLEFIGLIENSQAVITDSFHALAFSVVFEKQFCIFPRCIGNRVSKSNNRMLDFLKKIDTEKCFVNTEEEVNIALNTKLDYMKIAEKLEKWIKESKNWLLESLKDNEYEVD